MTSLRGKLYQTLSLAYYYVFVAPLGRGMHRTPKSWDAQYRSGYWEIFRTTAEMPRYAIIASHIRRWKSDPVVLDVGCGYGQLFNELGSSTVNSYVGIDLSPEAIGMAQSKQHPKASFIVANVDEWQSDCKFDIIVFNDVLYYLRLPVDTLERYQQMLSPGGVMIVAMFRHRNTMVIWKNIARRLDVADPIEVRNAKGELTDIRIVTSRLAARPSRSATLPQAKTRP